MPLDPLNDPLLRAPRSHAPTIAGMTEAANTATPEQLADFVDAIGASGGGGGHPPTDLGATATPTGVTVTSSTGADALLPLATAANAGLMAPAQHAKLADLPTAATLATDQAAQDLAIAGKADASHTHTPAAIGAATAAQGAKADTALQPGALPAGTTIPAAQISDATAPGRALLTAADAAAQRTALALGNVSNTADADKPVSTAQALAITAATTADAIADTLETAPAADLARIQSSVSGYFGKTAKHLASLLAARQDTALFLASDSTGDATTEWYYQLGVRIAAAYPEYRIEHRLWNMTTLAYDAPTLIANPAQTPVLAFDDTFTTAGTVTFGRKPDRLDGGASNSWSRDGAMADGDWTIAGGKLVRSADATVGGVIAGNGIAGEQKITLHGLTFSTIGDGVGTQIFIAYLHYIDGSNSLMAQIRVSSAGVVTFYLFERTAAANSPILTVASPASIPGNTAAVTGDLVIARTGNTVSASFGGTALGTANMTAPSIAAVAGSTQFGISCGNGNLIGMTIDRVTMDVTPLAPVLQMYNGAAPGQTLAYQITNQTAQLPIAFDAIFINHSHNYGLTTPAQFAGTVRSYVAQLPTAQKYADIIIRSQNPQKNPAIYPTQHANRNARIPVLARAEGWGYIGCYEAIVATPNYLDLINADGVHPLPACSTIEADTAMSWLGAQVG